MTTKSPNALQKLLSSLNNMEFWPVWIGLSWFTVLLLMRFNWQSSPPKINLWSNFSELTLFFTSSNVSGVFLIIAGLFVSILVVQNSTNSEKVEFFAYTIVFIAVFVSKLLGAQTSLHQNGFGDSVWCIIVGCLIRLIFPKWSRQILPKLFSLEFFIKIGIVLLAINMKEIASAGLRGIFVSWVETSILVVTVYYIGVKLLGMSSIESLITSCGLSICGSSAAMAISSAIDADQQITANLITIMSILTVPLIPILPIVGNKINLSDQVVGAWIGGSIDSTGAVTASASLANITTLQTAIIIKMLQNIIIGPVTLVVTSLWLRTMNPYLLWSKFPKFVLGFIVVSIITTILSDNVQQIIVNDSFTFSEWFSSVSFLLIGMDIELRNIDQQFKNRRKMLLLYCIGQLMDLLTTFGAVWLMFAVIQS